MSDTSTDAPALPGDGLREAIVDELRAALGEQLLDTHLVPQRDLWAWHDAVPPNLIAWQDSYRRLF